MRLYFAAVAALAIATPSSIMAQTPAAASEAAIVAKAKVAPGGLYELVYNPVDKKLYVAATGPRGAADAARVVIVDPVTLKVEGEIDVSAAAAFGLGIDTKAQLLYGTSTRVGVVTITDIKTRKVVATLKPEGSNNAHLREVVIDEATGKAYAGVMASAPRGAPEGTPAPAQEIWVIDGPSRKLDRVIKVDTKGLTGLTVDPKGGRLFTTGMSSNEVLSIDIKTGTVKGRWASGGETPINLAYDAAGKRLFVANQKSGDLTVLDSETGVQKAKVATGEGALSVAFNPDKQQVYVANRVAGTLTIIDAKTYTVIANIKTGTLPQTIAVDRKTGTVFVTNKARGAPRGAPAGSPPVEDPDGDTVVSVRP